MGRGVEYLPEAVQQNGAESLESYMETAQTVMLNSDDGVQDPLEIMTRDANYGDPEYSVFLDREDEEVAIDPEKAYVHVTEGSKHEEYVLIGVEEDAIGVLSSFGGHIVHADGATEEYQVNNDASNPLVSGAPRTVERAELFYELVDHWEQVKTSRPEDGPYLELEGDEDDIRILGKNQGSYEKHHGKILDRLAAEGEVVIDGNAHHGSVRGNHIPQKFANDIKRMDGVEETYGINPENVTYELGDTAVIRHEPSMR